METNFNFKSQICTDRFQSERLLSLGLKKETADMCWIPEVDFDVEGEPYDTGKYFERPMRGVWDCTLLEGIPAWSLHRLIEMTKLKVTPFLYGVEISHPLWERAFVRRANVWDNLCDCIEWLIKEGHFNKEYLCKR